MCRDHALEFSIGHDRPQSRTALAAGCPIVVKPAEATPLSALALAVLAEEAGLPEGLFSVVTGKPQEIGSEFTSSPSVRKLSFTGSTAVGRMLMERCGATVKRLSLELGGNAPFIVFADADLDAAVAGAVVSKYRNAGQTCVCANRFYVHEAVYDTFLNKLVAAVARLEVGDGAAEGVQIGPLIDARAVAKVRDLIADAQSKGARVVLGEMPGPSAGAFVRPTIIANAHSGMRLSREEIFGPVAPVFKFHNEDKVVGLANDTEYGLAAYFYTRDIATVWRIYERLGYGMVGINTGLISTEVAPFGGVKQSGFGREGARQGIDEYLSTKYGCFAL